MFWKKKKEKKVVEKEDLVEIIEARYMTNKIIVNTKKGLKMIECEVPLDAQYKPENYLWSFKLNTMIKANSSPMFDKEFLEDLEKQVEEIEQINSILEDELNLYIMARKELEAELSQNWTVITITERYIE